MTKIIGLTGGIGSGKSTVAKYLVSKNIPVYIADDEARKIMQSKSVINAVVKVFGLEVLGNDGLLDRKTLANIVFNDKEKLALLNGIVHPKVKKHFESWVEKNKTHPFVVKEVAILFETQGHLQCDKTILVTAPLNVKIERTMKRDHVTKEEVLLRIQNQLPDEEKIKLADYVIQNINLEETYNQIDELLKDLFKM
ncbi:MAG: dephospho-CoA kinase [Flavobacteriaceae bacterium]|nr:dephospho-CoA kinase [Flavobacteriaceae bacterium]